MKKNVFLFAAMFSMAIAPVALTSCGDDDPIDPIENPDDPNNGGSDNGGSDNGGSDNVGGLTPINEVWEAQKQKNYLEDVGLELNGMIKADEFKVYTDFAEYFDEKYVDDSDMDAIGEWAEDIFDELTVDLKKTTETTNTSDHTWDSNTYYHTYKEITNHYKATILASNYQGHWTARNGKWNYEKADDLQFIFTGKSGQQCVLSLTTSGKVTKVHIGNIEDWGDYNYKEIDDYHTESTEYRDLTNLTIGFPEKITVTLKEGSTTLVSTVLNTSFSGINSEDEFDIQKATLAISSETKLSNGYSIIAENIQYNSTAATAKATLKKGNKTLVTTTASANPKNIPSISMKEFYDMDDDEVEKLFEKTTCDVVFSIDVLGKVQLKGTISDIRALSDTLDEAYDDDENESAFKNACNKANKYIDVSLYFNGGKAKQASLKLDYFSQRDYDETYYDFEPVISFSDGSSYSMDQYFSEDDFKDLIDAFEALCDDFEKMVD